MLLHLACVQSFMLLLLPAAVSAAAHYPPKPKDLTTPVQQRIAISGASSMSIGWNTYKKLDQPCVEYGTSSDRLSMKACSDAVVTYPTSRTYFNTVQLHNLTSATTYYYKIVSTNSTVGEFLSPRIAGDKSAFTMNVVIDLGVYGADGFTIKGDSSRMAMIPTVDPSLNHTTIGRLMATEDDYELVVHPGDFAYADDWFERPRNLLDGKDAYEAILETFYDQLAPVAGRKAYMASPGNHEADCQEIPYTSGLCPEGQRNFTDFMNRFGGGAMPTAFPSTSANDTARVRANEAARLANPPFWYSFEYGMVHVAMIDTETDFPEAPDGLDGDAGLQTGPFGKVGQQLAFLEADLASVDRSVTPWLLVAGHRPWYTASNSGCEPCREAFEGLLFRYGVDVGIFGHEHNSQRFLPAYGGAADPAGLRDPAASAYLVAGGAGNIEGLSRVDDDGRSDLCAFAYDDAFAYATLTFADAQHLRVRFVSSETGQVLDDSTLFKSHDRAFVRQ
ncbi:Metallo-dependent phosphatase-like protein [Xylariomycetidae sp. FL0641]|nr:Metallo-dependent phosphatase-like protein [Xylariomycetidae sp. FL0641]